MLDPRVPTMESKIRRLENRAEDLEIVVSNSISPGQPNRLWELLEAVELLAVRRCQLAERRRVVTLTADIPGMGPTVLRIGEPLATEGVEMSFTRPSRRRAEFEQQGD